MMNQLPSRDDIVWRDSKTYILNYVTYTWVISTCVLWISALIQSQQFIFYIKKLTALHCCGRLRECFFITCFILQIVSVDSSSSICVWSIVSGEKVMEFFGRKLRKGGESIYIEVTAMAFDPTYRRLICGFRDGCVRIFNANNGAILRELPTREKVEVRLISLF